MKSYNSFQTAQKQVLEAAKILDLDKATTELIAWPQREFLFTLPVKMDDNRVKIFHACRIQYNSARGPAKGGIRFYPSETIDTKENSKIFPVPMSVRLLPIWVLIKMFRPRICTPIPKLWHG
jgi:glutamate dehydrogenase/leucine dehydrogenase